MIKRMLCMLLVICMLCAPALAEEGGIGLLLELTGRLVKMFDQESSPDPYLWMFEQETTNASIDDLPEIAQMLRDLGIDEITEQVEDNYRKMTEEVMLLMSQHGNEYAISREQMILGLLYTAGSEQRGEDGCVYAFDAEVYESETMYRDFLKGIERIGNGELKFDNIVEDLSGVDPETGDGTRKVTFDFKGETITYEALAQHDWFDAGMLGFMHEVIGTGESGRQLYFIFDGMQGVVLFYQTPQWAQAFTKATNCPLFTGM